MWRANIGEGRWRAVPFDQGVQFPVQEIAFALRKVKPPVAEPERVAERIHRVTEGVPLPTRWLLDAHEQGVDVSEELDTLESGHEDPRRPSLEEKIIRLMAERFLYHLINHPERAEDLKDIIALSLLTEVNYEVLGRLWEDVPERLVSSRSATRCWR